MISEWFAVLVAVLMYLMGFLTCGVIIGKSAFWQGVADGLSLWFLWDRETVRRRLNGKR